MKMLGIILIVAGILMLVFANVSFTSKKKVADLGPVEINKTEKKTIAWPNYAGALVLVAGVVVLATGGKKQS